MGLQVRSAHGGSQCVPRVVGTSELESRKFSGGQKGFSEIRVVDKHAFENQCEYIRNNPGSLIWRKQLNSTRIHPLMLASTHL